MAYLKSWEINYCHITNQHPQLCLIPKIQEKKNNWVLLGIFGLNFRKKLLSYMNSGTSNLSICKILRKNKNTRFWNKMPVLGIFELEFENNIVKIEITTLQFV